MAAKKRRCGDVGERALYIVDDAKVFRRCDCARINRGIEPAASGFAASGAQAEMAHETYALDDSASPSY